MALRIAGPGVRFESAISLTHSSVAFGVLN
jgi:hypothetical protein